MPSKNVGTTYAPTTEALSASTPVTSSLVPALKVPTHGAGGSFSILTKTHISAAPTAVLAAIRNTSTWPEWNTFCPSCTITSPSIKDVALKAKTNVGVPPDTLPGFETGLEGWLEKGTAASVEVFMDGKGLSGGKKERDQGIEITVLEVMEGERGLRIAWKSTGMSHWQLHSERVFDLIAVDGGQGTEYTCWETFGGMLGSVAKAMVGAQLVDRFGDYARDLKGFVEGRS